MSQDELQLPWRPETIWQILRRSKSYRVLFAEYEAWASTEVTGKYLEGFRFLRSGQGGSWAIPQMHRPYPPVHTKFLQLYGDILVFPFPPDIADPETHIIRNFVISYPALIEDPQFNYNEDGDLVDARGTWGANILNQSLTIDLNHSDEAIIEDITRQIREVLEHCRHNGRNPIYVKADGRRQQLNWDQLQMQLKAWDEAERYRLEGGQPNYVEICRKVNPGAINEHGNASKQAYSWARQAVESATKHIELFERR